MLPAPGGARRAWPGPSRLASALALIGAVVLGACTAAGPPKPPPPPIEGIRDVSTPGPQATALAQAPAPPPFVPGVPTAGPPAAPPTLPAVVAQAVTAAPAPLTDSADPDVLPPAREVANGMIAALSKVKTARLAAQLPNGHTTDLLFAAPDRAALIEHDATGQEYARYVIINDTGYVYDPRSGSGWRKVVNEGYRKQTQIFRPMQIALATGEPRALPSGAEVERVEEAGKPALRAMFEYGDSAELQELGLMRSSGNLLEVVVDPTTWLPLRTREETITGGPEKAVTEVTFVQFDQPVTVDPPTS